MIDRKPGVQGLATDAPEEPVRGLLTNAELAARGDFRLGDTLVSPSMRNVRGPGGTADLEPRVMQVLVVLADAANHVVTRQALFDRCWGAGNYVGDDSLNRAVGAVRRIAHDIAGGGFEIETIPRTGYRLTIYSETQDVAEPVAVAAPAKGMLTRRAAVGTALATAAVAAGGIGLWSVRSEQRRQFDQLLDRAERALESADPAMKPHLYFQRAAAMRPDDVRGKAFLAYSLALLTDGTQPGEANAFERSERAAQASLVTDPRNAFARLATILLQRATLDLATTEHRLRAVLRDSPANMHVMRHLWGLLQSTGRSRDSLSFIERAAMVSPLAAIHHYPRAQLLWILGQNAEADRVIDLAMRYWPAHRFVRFARFTIFAFTDRARAALSMLEKPETTPQNYSPAAVSLWRASLPALDDRSPAAIATARDANLAAARRDLSLASQAVLTLSVLGEIDAAFEIANGLLQFRQPVSPRSPATGKAPRAASGGWRFSPWLFTPPLALLRADPRFETLCDGIGLTEYWSRIGVVPDYRRSPA